MNTCDCPFPTTRWLNNQCVCPEGRYGENCLECPAPRIWDSVAKTCSCNIPSLDL